MGIYVFDSKVMIEALHEDAANSSSRHDMGGDIIPMLVAQRRAQVYDFLANKVPGAEDRDAGYWRDVGTLDSYFEAQMDLCAVHPIFNLYNDRWPILTHVPSQPPAKFVHDSQDRVGRAINSIVSNGVIISGGLVRDAVLSPGVRVNSWSTVSSARSCCTTPTSAATPWSGTPSWTRTWSCPRASRSAWTRSTTGPAASWSPKAASPWSARARRYRA